MQLPVLGCTFLTLSDREESTAENQQLLEQGSVMISALMISASSATHQFRPPVPSSTTTCAQQCPPVPPSSATHLCPAVPTSATKKCHLPVPSSTTHQCPSVQPSS
ncbi:unnamed protein product, partial [Staurois parvus]